MKYCLIFLLSISILISSSIKTYADEGMWIPMLIGKNYNEMKKLGLKLSSEDIYSINKSSLKDAIVQFGNGCTGEIVSNEGLIFTNHHCGYGQIQAHSSVQNDYLTDGFWAYSKDEELSNPGLTVKFLIRMDDVTSKILSNLSDTLTEAERDKAIYKTIENLTKEAEEGTHYDAIIKPFFDGNQYFMFIYEIFKDVRLVGAPPSAIGKFGGDVDNWMWPRHTGDFSIFRVYMGKDGKPAEYSKDNIPYVAKHFLPISIKDVKKDDFAMILGYSGRTNRYQNSYGVKQAIDLLNLSIVKIRDNKLNILREDMASSSEIRIKYASKYARTSNYWKYYIGQTKQLKQLKVYDKKVELENEFQNWVNAEESRKSRYGSVLKDIETSWNELKDYNLLKNYTNEAALGIDLIGFAISYGTLHKVLSKKDTSNTKKIEATIANLESNLDGFYKDFNLETDKKLFITLLNLFYNDIPTEYHPSFFQDIAKKYKGDFKKYADYAFNRSIFVSKEKLSEFLKKPDFKILDNDPIYIVMYSVIGNYRKYYSQFKPTEDKLEVAVRLFMEGLMKMKPDYNFYPNANSTMRVTYGTVQDYIPRDGVEYDYVTTIEGIIEKENNESLEFVVPTKLKELYNAKDYGQYGKDNNLVVCFTTNNDITGGNSGSPVINGNGELIGIAFDGNWEAMSGDIAFEPSLQRTIIVDSRYVLFIIDKYAGASNLINELKIIK